MIRATIHAPSPEPEAAAEIRAALAAAYRDADVLLHFEQRSYHPHPALEALSDRAGVPPSPERLDAWPVLPEEPPSPERAIESAQNVLEQAIEEWRERGSLVGDFLLWRDDLGTEHRALVIELSEDGGPIIQGSEPSPPEDE